MKVKRRAGRLAAVVLAAGLLHAAAGRHLAATDPIAALLGHHAASVVVAAIGLGVARLFLYVIAPAMAAHLAACCVGRAIARARAAS